MNIIKITRTYDVGLIKSILTHPEIYSKITDDGSPDADNYEPPMGESFFWLIPEIDGNVAGIYFAYPINAVCCEGHANILPEYQGKAVNCTLAAIRWMFSNTPCRRIITNVPDYHIRACKFVEKLGFVKFGVNEKSYLKGGKLHDLIMYGISKSER